MQGHFISRDVFLGTILKQLKSYARNMVLLKSSFIEGHLVFEAMYYMTKYV